MAGASSLATSFNNLAGTPSGPAALCGFKFRNNLATPEQLTIMSSVAGCELAPMSAEMILHL